MSQITCNLCKNLIVREEDSIYLFNKQNSAVVRMPRVGFDEFNKGSVPCTSSFKEAVKALHGAGMIEIADHVDSLVDTNNNSQDTPQGTFSNIFGLRSKRNSFAVLWAITPKCNLSCYYCFPEVHFLVDGDITTLWRSSEQVKQLRALKEKSLQEIPGCKSCEVNTYCDGGCRGDALFYHGDLYGYPSRCPKEMQLYSSNLKVLG